MKKLLAMLLALAMMLGCAAFGEDVDYTGTWVLTGAESGGVELSAEMIALVGLDMTLVFDEDGTVTISMWGMEEAGTWVATENGVAITDADETLAVPYQDGALLIDQDGTIMKLTREGAVAAEEEEEAVPTVSAADFDFAGYWVVTSIEMMGMSLDPATLGVSAYMELFEDGTCYLVAMEETQDGTWAVTETGIETTDAAGVVDIYTLVGEQLVVEMEGMKMIFTREEYTVPLTGLTVADFNGDWEFAYVEVMNETYDAEEIETAISLHIEDGKGHVVTTYPEGVEEYDAVCEVEEVEDFGTVMYFLYLDPATEETTGYGMMLLLFDNGELVWYSMDEQDVTYFYCFVPAEA